MLAVTQSDTVWHRHHRSQQPGYCFLLLLLLLRLLSAYVVLVTDCDDVSTRQATNTWDSTSVLLPLIYSVRHARVPAPSLSPPSLPSSLPVLLLPFLPLRSPRLFALPLTTNYSATDRALDPLTVLPVWLSAGGIWGIRSSLGGKTCLVYLRPSSRLLRLLPVHFGPLSNLRDVPVCLPDTVVIEMLAVSLRIQFNPY
jgi:hypothetical protein